ncbi:MAG: energy transducer TonB [Polaromonas sp.]
MNATAFSGVVAAPLSAAFLRPPLSRNALIALAVVLLHVGFIWALQSGLLLRSVELIVPAEVLSQLINPPAPKAEPAPPAPPVPQKQTSPVVQKKSVAKARVPAPQPPQPLAIADAAPAAAEVPTAVVSAAPAAPVAVAPGPSTPPGPTVPPAVQLPSTNADYLQNPKPAYPPLSKRMGEQGKVIVRVLIGADGAAQKAEIRQSSGFERLDQAALNTVLKWRYVPGKRGGVAEDMWFNVPINFVLE